MYKFLNKGDLAQLFYVFFFFFYNFVFYKEDLAPGLLDDGLWLFSLLVENPFEDYYVALHLQTDLCYDYC